MTTNVFQFINQHLYKMSLKQLNLSSKSIQSLMNLIIRHFESFLGETLYMFLSKINTF